MSIVDNPLPTSDLLSLYMLARRISLGWVAATELVSTDILWTATTVLPGTHFEVEAEFE